MFCWNILGKVYKWAFKWEDFKVKCAKNCLKCTIRTYLSDILESMRTFSVRWDVCYGLQTGFNWFYEDFEFGNFEIRKFRILSIFVFGGSLFEWNSLNKKSTDRIWLSLIKTKYKTEMKFLQSFGNASGKRLRQLSYNLQAIVSENFWIMWSISLVNSSFSIWE